MYWQQIVRFYEQFTSDFSSYGLFPLDTEDYNPIQRSFFLVKPEHISLPSL